jgi:hypothetical protein
MPWLSFVAPMFPGNIQGIPHLLHDPPGTGVFAGVLFDAYQHRLGAVAMLEFSAVARHM